jgi:uncharacterized membrane protein YqjE
MVEHNDTMRGLIRDMVSDARSLIRDEIFLARAELREQTAEARTLGMVFGAALLLALTGVILLAVAIGAGLADVLDWPAWAGYAMVAVLAGAGAFVFQRMGRARVATLQIMPKTRASLQENIAWIQSKSITR